MSHITIKKYIRKKIIITVYVAINALLLDDFTRLLRLIQ